MTERRPLGFSGGRICGAPSLHPGCTDLVAAIPFLFIPRPLSLTLQGNRIADIKSGSVTLRSVVSRKTGSDMRTFCQRCTAFSSLRDEQKTALEVFFTSHHCRWQNIKYALDWLSARRRAVTRTECLAFQPVQSLTLLLSGCLSARSGMFSVFFVFFHVFFFLFLFECALCDRLCFHSSVLRVWFFSKMHPKSPCTCALMHSEYIPGIK